MSREQLLTQSLTERFSPDHLEVEDESHMHSGKAGKSTHFRVVIVSGQFAGKRSVERHRMVNAALREHFEAGLHALSLSAIDPDEWAEGKRGQASPNCVGKAG